MKNESSEALLTSQRKSSTELLSEISTQKVDFPLEMFQSPTICTFKYQHSAAPAGFSAELAQPYSNSPVLVTHDFVVFVIKWEVWCAKP